MDEVEHQIASLEVELEDLRAGMKLRAILLLVALVAVVAAAPEAFGLIDGDSFRFLSLLIWLTFFIATKADWLRERAICDRLADLRILEERLEQRG